VSERRSRIQGQILQGQKLGALKRMGDKPVPAVVRNSEMVALLLVRLFSFALR
jgi:hypothetical protein